MIEVRKATYETRIDARVMAALCIFYKRNNTPRPSLANLIATALDDFLAILEKNNVAVRVRDTLEAKKLLEAEFGRATHRRGERGLIRQIQVEEGAVARAEIQPATKLEDIKFGERPKED